MSNTNHKRVEFPQAKFVMLFTVILVNSTEPREVAIPVKNAGEVEEIFADYFNGTYCDMLDKDEIKEDDVESVKFAGIRFADVAVAEGKVWANLTDDQSGTLELSQYSPDQLDAAAKLDKIRAILGDAPAAVQA